MVSIADQPASVPPATSTRSIPSGTGTAYQRFWLTKADRCSCHWLTRRACSACAACSAALLVRAEPLDPQPLGVDPLPQRPLAPPDRVAAQPRDHQAGGDGRRGDDGGHPAGGGAGRERERGHGRGGDRQPQRPRDAGFPPAAGPPASPADSRGRSGGTGRPRRRPGIGVRGRVLPPQVQRGHARAPRAARAAARAAVGPARQPGRHHPAGRDEPLSRPAHREDELRLAERQQGPRRDHGTGDKVRRGRSRRARPARRRRPAVSGPAGSGTRRDCSSGTGRLARRAVGRGSGHRRRWAGQRGGERSREQPRAGPAWRGWRPGPGRRRGR